MQKSIILFLIFYSLLLEGQNHFGLRGGINFANVSTTENGAITNDKIAGANSAIFFDIGIGERIGIQPELNFIQRGFRRNINEANDWHYKLNYFDLSFLLKYKLNKKQNQINGFGILGPYIGRAISGSRKNQYDGEVEDYDFKSGIRLEQIDFGVLIGGGIELPSRAGNWVIDLRYSLGLININSNYLADGNIRNHGVVISAGYTFLLGSNR